MPTAGYNVYKRETIDGADTLLQLVPAGYALFNVAGSPNASFYVHVKAVNSCGIEDDADVDLRRVSFNVDGLLRPPVEPTGLTLAVSGGAVTASWQYLLGTQQIGPEQFNVYVAVDDEDFNFAFPEAEVDFVDGQIDYSQDLGSFADGQLVRVVVRAESAGGAVGDNMAVAAVRVSTAAPTAPAAADVEVAVS